MTGRWPTRIVIGLTGNIATGKSAVMRMVAERGALALDADKIVHDILEQDPSMQAAIAVAFGDHLRRRDGSIDRAALGAIVFDDPKALRDLEMLIHPAVRVELIRRIEASNSSIVIVEAIKLLEGGLAELCDRVWVTRCPRELQVKRLMICRGMDGETAATRIDAQNPQEAKVARADVVIDTDGVMAETTAQVEKAWQRVQALLPDDVKEPDAAAARETAGAETVKNAREKRPQLDTVDSDKNVLVRRARPSDIPSLLLLMQRASNGKIRLSRAEMLASFSERSYLIAQIGADVVGVVGWNTDSTTAVCVDQIYAHPRETIHVAGPAILQEIEQSARVLICEVVLFFLSAEGPRLFEKWLDDSGYERMEPQQMRRAWRRTVEERQPPGTVIMGKVLRDVRVA